MVSELLRSGRAARRADPWAAVRFWGGIGLVVPPAWLGVLLVGRPGPQHRLLRRCARLALTLAGVRLEVTGLEGLPAGPAILVANHASYLDGVVLVAALPRPLAFVAKAELRGHPLAGPFLRRTGTVFVARGRDVRLPREALGAALAAGRLPVVFPEGTFRRAPGLLPFRPGAFTAAAALRVPVVPTAILGARRVLPDGSWWPRAEPVRVVIGPPLVPEGRGFREARRLSEAARRFLLSATGEPDLARARERMGAATD